MKVDNNKGIDYIEYNHLNLPITIILESQEYSGRIRYSYDATGVKQKKIVEDYTIPSSPSIKETHYVGSFIYEQQENQVPELKFFSHAEGYFEPNSPPSGELEGVYVYQYKDHTSTMLSAGLGNIRLSYKDNNGNLEIVEENNYYPFGLKHKEYNNQVTSTNSALNYKYNGKELNEELDLNWYDYGARNYDAALGRWMNIDPMAHKYDNFSPYAYILNNPIFFIDPDGMDVVNGAQIKLEQAEAKLAQAEAAVASGESKYGTKKKDFNSKADFKRYKGYKKEVRQGKREVNKLKADVKATENLISELKSDRSNTFEKLDNLTNEAGETVDVYIHVTSNIPRGKDGETMHSFNIISDDNADHIHVVPETGFKVNSIEVIISNNPSGDRTTLTVMDHERGHVIYQSENTTSYYQYLQKKGKLNKKYDGHAKDDPSGHSADYLQDKGDTSKFYKNRR